MKVRSKTCSSVEAMSVSEKSFHLPNTMLPLNFVIATIVRHYETVLTRLGHMSIGSMKFICSV